MLITLWPSLGANRGARVDVPWTGLGALIASLPDGALFSCATFEGDRREAGETARLFEAATAIVLDHDAAVLPFAQICEALKSVSALVYETKTPGRWRALLPLSAPIVGYDAYTLASSPLREAFRCARESSTGAQMWYPPRRGFRYLSPFDGEARLIAWITGDYANEAVKGDLPRHDGDAGVDRSKLDMMILHRLAEIGVSEANAKAVLVARGALSHRTDPAYLEMTWSKSTAYRQWRNDQGLWSNAPTDPSVIRPGITPEIRTGPDIHRVADESVSALSIDEHLFTRDASIVELTRSKRGLPLSRALSAASILDRLSKNAVFYAINKDGEPKRAMPSDDLCKIVKDRGTYPQLRELRGIVEVPILRPDGTIAEAPGYDPETRFYRAEGLALSVSQTSATEALAALRKPFLEFPWAQPEMIDIAVALICSVACRSAIQGNVPLFVFDASQSGSGKTLLVETISAIALGQASGAGRFPGDDDELAKALAGYARSSTPLIAYDNVTRVVQGAAIDSALTCNGRWSFRILGQSKIQVCDWYSVIAVNGNQIRVGGDTRRRAVVGRLTPAAKRDTYAIELPRYAYEHRAELLSAAIALVRAGILAGTPKLGHRPSFEVFIRTIAGAIVAAGGYDITAFWREEETQSDSDDAREAMALWIALRWPAGATASQIVDDMGDSFMASPEALALFKAYALEKPVKEALRHVAEAHPKATKRQAMAYALHSWRDIPSAGGRLKIVSDSGKGAVWRANYIN